MVNNLKFVQMLFVLALCVMSFLVTFTMSDNSKTMSEVKDPAETSYRDRLSGETYSKATFRNSSDVNPYLSSFVGFGALSKNGITNDEQRYIQDFLLNYALYSEGVKEGTISYAGGSYRWHGFSGDTTTYEFRFGIDKRPVQTLRVSYDDIAQNISLSIVRDDKTTVYEKGFRVHTEVD